MAGPGPIERCPERQYKKWWQSAQVRAATRPIHRGALGPRRSEPVRAAPLCSEQVRSSPSESDGVRAGPSWSERAVRSALVRAAPSDGMDSRGKSPRSSSRPAPIRSERLVTGARSESELLGPESGNSSKSCGPTRTAPPCTVVVIRRKEGCSVTFEMKMYRSSYGNWLAANRRHKQIWNSTKRNV